MSTLRALALASALIVALLPGEARAGKAEDAKAAKLFEQAEVEYQAGHFQGAIDLLLEAQELAPDPVLHYNLARAWEGLGDLDHAIASYRAYVEGDPGSKDRGAVEARLKTLEQQRAERDKPAPKPEPDPVPKAPPPPPPAPRSPSPAPWIVAGAGVLGLGAAGTLAGLSLARSSEAEDPATSGADVVDLLDQAETFALGANIGFAAGGAIALAGAIWGIVDVASAGGDAASAARLEVGPLGARATVRF